MSKIFLVTMLVIIMIIVIIIFTCTVYVDSKEIKECKEWSCNKVGQICPPHAQGAYGKTWICDGATWHNAVNVNVNDSNIEYVKQCNDWSCNKAGQVCPSNAEGAEGRTWICDGETWHQAVRPF